MQKLLLILLISKSLCGYGQKEADNWFFGDYAAINFSTGTPQVINGSLLATDEGCTSISDSAGNLLFYTDGSYIWNKNHQIMSNGSGLKGNLSSTQSSIVVKKPNSNNLYYVFTLDDYVGPDGLQYSIVDITKQSGLGEVITKNVFITNGLTEKISVARSCDNNSFWIVVHEYNSNKFLSYKLDKNGFNTTPVTTNIGSNHNHGHPTKSDCSGFMKISPNSRFLAAAIGYTQKVELFNFDNSTGKLSNYILIDNLSNPYGLEFSPNSELLYVSELYGNNIEQFSLKSKNASTIKSTKLNIGYLAGTYGGAIQIANNGKIYCGSRVSQYLSCIDFPNNYGTSCNFSKFNVNLESGRCRFGFPNILPNYFSTKSTSNKIIVKEGCKNNLTFLSFTDSSIVSSATWYFGDKLNSKSNKFSTSFTYKDTGTYYIKLIYNHSVCSKDSIFYKLTIKESLKPNLGIDIKLCSLLGTQLKSNLIAKKYQWNNSLSDTFITYTPKYFGQHILTTFNDCGILSDTIMIDSLEKNLPFSLGNDTVICNQINYFLKGPNKYSKYLWNTGDTTRSISVKNAGDYWLLASNSCGSHSDTIKISNENSIKFELGNDTMLCFGNSLQLYGPPNCKKYNWSNNETTQNILITNFGKHYLNVIDSNNCPASDSINIIDKKQKLIINLGEDTTYCSNFTKKLIVGNYSNIIWNTGETSSTITVNKSGRYIVSIFNGCFWESDTININQANPIKLNLGPDTSVCFARPFKLAASGNFIGYKWNTGENTQEISIRKIGKYWCKTTDINLCETIDTIEFKNTIGNKDYFIPNAFSPNDDFINETFPFQIQDPNTVIKIYNRWGELIYENYDGFSWNGKIKDENASQDVYMFILVYKNCNRTKQTLSGTFTLLR